MNTQTRINELNEVVKFAVTYTSTGRQEVANACRELYNLIEGDYFKAGAGVLINDMYKDLTSGNFAEPYMCEMKKGKFELYRRIYINNVMPELN